MNKFKQLNSFHTEDSVSGNISIPNQFIAVLTDNDIGYKIRSHF